MLKSQNFIKLQRPKRWIKPHRRKTGTNQSLVIFRVNFSRLAGEHSQSHAGDKKHSCKVGQALYYTCASCSRQLIGNTRQQVGKSRVDVSPSIDKWSAVSHSFDMILLRQVGNLLSLVSKLRALATIFF